MAFSGGVFTLVAGNPVVTGTVISSTTMNNTLSDIATGLSTCILKDGSQTITANIPMSSFKLTGLAAGSASGDSLRYEQVNGLVTTAGDLLYATSAGTLARLALGTAGQTLLSGASAPAWGNCYQIISFTRDLTAASGSQAVTGAGFKPTAVIFIGSINAAASAIASFGFSNISSEGVVWSNADGIAGHFQTTNVAIRLADDGSNFQKGVVASFDSDGFTITWTKLGSPGANTATVYALCMR